MTIYLFILLLLSQFSVDLFWLLRTPVDFQPMDETVTGTQGHGPNSFSRQPERAGTVNLRILDTGHGAAQTMAGAAAVSSTRNLVVGHLWRV